MNDSIELIKEKAACLLGKQIISVEPFTKITNNLVYKLVTAHENYIFKVYKQDWPEDGKLMYVNRRLAENGIPCAKINFFIRRDDYFPHGFLIEEFLSGITADKAPMEIKEDTELFGKLAVFAGRLHLIKLPKYGYVGFGNPMYETYSGFIADSFEDITDKLTAQHLIGADELKHIRNILTERLSPCDSLPSVLCHGDLSKKNIMIREDGSIILIDYDDVTALPWVADTARLTLWMKLNYNPDTAKHLRNIFLDNYSADNKNIYDDCESALHVWYSLDYMNFFAGSPKYDKVKAFFTEAMRNFS